MRKTTGDIGERLAGKYAKKQGMKIIEKNFRALRGEIDIIAVEGDQLVFIEVKTNKEGNQVPPENRVNISKQKQIGKVAQMYLQQSGKTGMDCRFDVIGVILSENGDHEISHIKNAFWL